MFDMLCTTYFETKFKLKNLFSYSADGHQMGEGNSFDSLLKATKWTDSGMYKIVMYTAIFAALISMVMYAILMIMASNGRERDESKKRIERGIVTVILIFSTVSIVLVVVQAFW